MLPASFEMNAPPCPRSKGSLMFSNFTLMSAPSEFEGISQAVYSFIPPTSLVLPVVSGGSAVTFALQKRLL